MIRLFVTVLLVGQVVIANAQQGSVVSDQLQGRQLSIYLPAGYAEATEKFPVAYFHDGQFLFTSKPGNWRLENLLDKLIAEGKLQPLIVVGIHSTENRTSDLVPYLDPYIADNFGPYQPKGRTHGNLIVKKLIPYIESKYKASPKVIDRSLIGVSFGGLHALWMAANFPETFGTIGAMSPSIWVAENRVYKEFRKKDIKSVIYFDIGTLEWNYYTPFIEVLEETGLEYGRDIFYFEDHGGMHNTAFWSERVIYPLILFKGEARKEIVNFEVKVEIIKSANSDRFFQRLNPVLQWDNGLKYSLNRFATFKILSGDGEVTDDGRFELRGGHLSVLVQYKDYVQTIELKKEEIELIKAQLLR